MSSEDKYSLSNASREWRLDVFRGLALVMIFINHIPDNVFSRFTTANLGFSDAAEVFVLLAGVSAAFAYVPKLERRGFLRSGANAWRRAFELYSSHLVLVLLACAAVSYAAVVADDPRFLAWINLGALFDDTADALIGIVTLGHQPSYFNILPLYVCLLVTLPAMLPLAVKRPWVLLALSSALWAYAGLRGVNLPHYPNEDHWFFNPLSWQFLFAVGLVAGSRAARGLAVIPRSRSLTTASAFYLTLSLAVMLFELPDWPPLGIPTILHEIDKTYLSLPRLLHVLALAVVVANLPVAGLLNRVDRFGLLRLLGRNGLPVFCLGSVLALTAQLIRFLAGGGIALDAALVFGGIALQLAFAALLEWMRDGQSRPMRGETVSAGRSA